MEERAAPEPEAINEGLRVDAFDYRLPVELIAQRPPAVRDGGRLMLVDRVGGRIEHHTIRDLPSLLATNDLLIVNDSRVNPARLFAHRAGSGGRIELLLLRPEADERWLALARPARRLSSVDRLLLEPRAGDAPHLAVEVVERREHGVVLLAVPPGFEAALPSFGTVPLPPYIREWLDQPERYQTIFADRPGSAAAPTAGLHFTPELLDRLRERGIGREAVTLHVGLDTFRPVAAERVAEHTIHGEWCEVPRATARELDRVKAEGGRVVAVGTTAARTLESYARAMPPETADPWSGSTDLFIVPGYRWRVVDALFTNFHLPRSTLLMMVSAFADRALVLRAYEEAVRARYRFFSFGDAMLIV